MSISIRDKILLVISALLSVALIAGAVGLVRIERGARALDAILREDGDLLTATQHADRYFAELEPFFHGSVDNAKSPAARVLGERIDQTLDAMRRMPIDHAEKAALSKAAGEWAEFRADWDAYIATADEAGRSRIYQTRLSPRGARLLQAITALRSKASEDILAASRDSRASIEAARWTLLALLIGAFVTALLLAEVIFRRVLRPLRQIRTAVAKIEAGELENLDLPESTDEFGAVGKTVRNAAAALRQLRRADAVRLESTRQTTQVAIDSLPHAVAMIGVDGKVELANALARERFGLAPGVPIDGANQNQKWLPPMFDSLVAAPRRLEPRGYESAVQVFDVTGERFYLPHLIPIMADGRLTGVTVVLVDATQLRRIDEAKSGLISIVSHELKTPLTSVQMCICLLADDPTLTRSQRELVQAASDDTARLGNLIESLLDMGRLQAGRARLHLEAVALGELVETALGPLRGAMENRTLSVERDLPADLPEVMVDRQRIRHAIENILSNAAKYTPAGGKVTMSASVRAEFVELHIADTGIGIPTAYLPHIFEKFVRVPNAASDAVSTGAGLGLAIAREILHAHGGEISVESREGQGSRFTLSLRRADKTWGPEVPESAEEA